MPEDPIVEEVRSIRDAHARKFNYDLEAIFRDLKEQERKSGRSFIRFPARPAAPARAPGKGPIAEKEVS